mgnify:FL=1
MYQKFTDEHHRRPSLVAPAGPQPTHVEQLQFLESARLGRTISTLKQETRELREVIRKTEQQLLVALSLKVT